MLLERFNTAHIHTVLEMTKIEFTFAISFNCSLLFYWGWWIVSSAFGNCSWLFHPKLIKKVIKIKTIKIQQDYLFANKVKTDWFY